MQWLASPESKLELGELESLILDREGAYLLPWRETLPLFSKTACYTNLLEKTFQGKG